MLQCMLSFLGQKVQPIFKETPMLTKMLSSSSSSQRYPHSLSFLCAMELDYLPLPGNVMRFIICCQANIVPYNRVFCNVSHSKTYIRTTASSILCTSIPDFHIRKHIHPRRHTPLSLYPCAPQVQVLQLLQAPQRTSNGCSSLTF